MAEKLETELSHKIKKLNIFTKRLITTRLVGRYRSRVKGKGLEFSNYREYTLEDDSNLIDWKASIRVNEPIIKEFVEERNLEVFFLIDVSSSMVFGSTKKLKNEYVTELVATLTYSVLRVGDSVGYCFFSDKIFNLNPPSHNKKLFYIISSSLLNPDIYGGTYDFELALKKITRLLKKNTILIIISDFIGLKKGWEDYLKKAAYKFDTIGIMVRDPRDKELPEDSDMILISDPYTNEKMILDPNINVRQRYKHYVENQEKEIESIFTESRASFLKLTTDKEFFVPIINFFKRRQKWSQ